MSTHSARPDTLSLLQAPDGQGCPPALHAQGVPDTYILTEQIPSRDRFGPIGPIGMGKNAIDFSTAFRYAVPDKRQPLMNGGQSFRLRCCACGPCLTWSRATLRVADL